MTDTEGSPFLHEWRLAVSQSDLPPMSKFVALLLQTYTTLEEPFVAEPFLRSLADETGLSERSVQNHLELLVERGWIAKEDPVVDGMRMISKRYVLMPPQP